MFAHDPLADSPDVYECQKFVGKAYGCYLARGSPCSSLFPLEQCIQLSFFTGDESDVTPLCLLYMIM